MKHKQAELTKITIGTGNLEHDAASYKEANRKLKRIKADRVILTYYFDSDESYTLNVSLPCYSSLKVLQADVISNWENWNIRLFAMSHNIGITETIC